MYLNLMEDSRFRFKRIRILITGHTFKVHACTLPVFLLPNRLAYNNSSNKMGNSPGVEVYAPHFGSTAGVSYLDPSLYHPGEYFAAMVDALVKIGLKDNVSIRAAPFDFRYAPSEV